MPEKLPANPSLENLRNQAKALLKAHGQGLPEANSRIQQFHPIREKLIEIYTEEVLDPHRKKINWPLTGTQFIEVESKLYSKARSLW